MPERKVAESEVERVKLESRGLRGTLAESLAEGTPAFGKDDVHLLKMHGLYQQDDRDVRHAGGEKHHWFMVRVKVPAGTLTAAQYLALDRLANRFSHDRSLRLTSRQGVQLHGVPKGNLKESLRSIDRALLTTFAACGDVGRNVMASPAPRNDPPTRAVRELASAISSELLPRTRAYHEVFLDGERVVGGQAEDEPLYGPQYLPRKFKVAVAVPDDNCVDLYSQDVGLLAVLDGDALLGVNLLVGGGLGMTHKKADTFARLGSELGFVESRHAVEAVRLVAEIFRDHGNRADRRHARLKYVVEAWGLARFREELARRASLPLHPWVPVGSLSIEDHLGAQPQGDGRYYYGVWVENGRVIDVGRRRTKTALARAVEALGTRVIVTPSQNLLLADLAGPEVETLDAILADHGVPRAEELSAARRFALACPALPTCSLALSEAERVMPEILDELEAELAELGLEDEPLTVRATGCPNGCARPYTADIGFVGHGHDQYDVYVGGGLGGDRLADLWEESLPLGGLLDSLRPLLIGWAKRRYPAEGLGDYYQRVLGERPRATVLTGEKKPMREIFERLAGASIPLGGDSFRPAATCPSPYPAGG